MMTRPMPRLPVIGGVSTLSAVALAIIPAFAAPMRNQVLYDEQLRTLPYVIVVVLIVAAVSFLLIVPWAARGSAARATITGLLYGVLSILTFVAFWSGLPAIFGGSAIALGLAAHERKRWLARTAIILGMVGVVLCVVVIVGDKLRILP